MGDAIERGGIMSLFTRRKFISGMLPGSFLLLSPYSSAETNGSFRNTQSTSSVDISNLNSSLIILECIDDLKKIIPEYSGQVVYVKSYYVHNNSKDKYLGGGFFYYDDEDAISPEDFILTFVSKSGGRWKRKLDSKIIDISMAGIICDGITDETIKLKSLIDFLSSLGGYIINGGGRKIITSSTVEIDLSKVGLVNIDLLSKMTSTDNGSLFILKISGSKTSNTLKFTKNNIGIIKNVTVSGEVVRDDGNVNGVLINPSADIANIDIYSLTIRKVNVGLVLGSNSYLITFTKLCIYNCNVCMTDSIFLKLESHIKNAGENIQFVSCTFANSNQIGAFHGMEAYLTFDKCSFDYTGGNRTQQYVQWEIYKQGITLNYLNCHFESGNKFDSLNDCYFYTNKSIRINIRGGVMQFGNTEYNACPYFFFDSSGKADFSIEDTFIYGLGVKRWANCGFRKFMPEVNFDTSHVSAVIQDNNYLIQDGFFSAKSIIDEWFFSEFNDSGNMNVATKVSNLKIIKNYLIDNESSNVLKVGQIERGQLFLVLNRPMSKFAPFISFEIKGSELQRGIVNFSLGLTQKSFFCDKNKHPLLIETTSKSNVNISDNVEKIILGKTLAFKNEYIKYDSIILKIDFRNFKGDDIFIRNVIVNSPF